MIDFMTLEQMRLQVGRHIGDTSANRTTRIDEWLNSHYASVAMAYRWPALMMGREETLTYVANSSFVFLPKDLAVIYVIVDGTRDEIMPHEVIEDFFARAGTTWNTAGGSQLRWSDAGLVGKKANVSSAETLTASSSVSTDTTQLIVRGLDSTGIDEITETLILPGTGASVTTTSSFSDIYSASTDGTQTGVISVDGVTSGTTYVSISTGERTARYNRIRVWFKPTSGTAFTIYGKRGVRRMVNDDDVPDLPVSNYLVERAVATQFSQQRKWATGAAYHEQRATEIIQDVLSQTFNQGERIETSSPVPSYYARGGRQVVVVSN